MKRYIWFLFGMMLPIIGACVLGYYLYVNGLININF